MSEELKHEVLEALQKEIYENHQDVLKNIKAESFNNWVFSKKKLRGLEEEIASRKSYQRRLNVIVFVEVLQAMAMLGIAIILAVKL